MAWSAKEDFLILKTKQTPHDKMIPNAIVSSYPPNSSYCVLSSLYSSKRNSFQKYKMNDLQILSPTFTNCDSPIRLLKFVNRKQNFKLQISVFWVILFPIYDSVSVVVMYVNYFANPQKMSLARK